MRGLLTPDVVWRESDGDLDYSGDHHSRETVAALLTKFDEITGGTFALEKSTWPKQHVRSSSDDARRRLTRAR